LIVSMTAYARAQAEDARYRVTVELRTLNSRSLDVFVRLSKNYGALEDALRKRIARAVRRGRVEVNALVEPLAIEVRAPRINHSLARFYWEQLQDLHRTLPGLDPPTLDHLLRAPNLFEAAETTEDIEAIFQLMNQAVEDALRDLAVMRTREGKALQEDLLARLVQIRDALDVVESRREPQLQQAFQRLKERIRDILDQVQMDADDYRLFQEIAVLADRSDINEEAVRIRSHLDQMESMIVAESAAEGRKLDFLTQELLREVNTIGSKSSDLEISRAVVHMKNEIGKLREQIQNVE
jgi:uncharacterized protein (TIGR00255 family)